MSILLRTAESYVRHLFGRYQIPHRYDVILHDADLIKAKRIMEIGTWKGARAKAMIEIAKKYHPASEVEYFGFDLFEPMGDAQFKEEISKQPPTREAIEKELQETGAKIKLFKGDTRQTLGEVTPTLPLMDIIFIDGGHSIETVENDWNYASKLMGDHTIVIFDDYWPGSAEGPTPVIDAIDRSVYTVEIVPKTPDVFFNPNWGKLVIQLARVTKKARQS